MLRTRVGGGFKPPPTAIGLVESRASCRGPKENRTENQPPATYCVTNEYHALRILLVIG